MCQCRKQSIYKPKYICLDCQKSFRDSDTVTNLARAGVLRVKCCPDCGKEMLRVGNDFRPPRRGHAQWKAIQKQVLDGTWIYTFGVHSCGCVERDAMPRTENEVGRLEEDRKVLKENRQKELSKFKRNWLMISQSKNSKHNGNNKTNRTQKNRC